jgi:hypothetical protein
MGYIARFSPQAWVRDNAIEVDPEGETEWVTQLEGLTEDNKRVILEEEDGLDIHDLLKEDPAAPEWVREWSGPFSIHVREEEVMFRTEVVLTILSEEPIDETLDIEDLVRECDRGDFVLYGVHWTPQGVTKEQMANLLTEAGSEPGFFQLEGWERP